MIWLAALPGVARGTCHAPLAELASAPTRSLRVALVQYEIRRPRDLADWESRIQAYVADAARQRAKLVVFPELISLEGLALLDPSGARPAEALREVAARYTGHFKRRFAEWSRQHGITILGGTWPELDSTGAVYNVAFVFGPDGALIHQQAKNHLTHDETNAYALTGATGNAIPFKIGDVDAAVAICFDCEFPNYLPAESGVIPELILVPSMTSDAFGKYRVERSSSARAVEYHSYVLTTGTVGGDPGDVVLGAHTSQALVLSPSDRRFPADGVLAKGPLDRSHVLVFDLDIARLRQSRIESRTFPARTLHGAGAAPPLRDAETSPEN